MILYQVVSSYHLLCALVHKERFNKDKKCVLLVSSWLVDKFPQYTQLCKYFSDVVVLDMAGKVGGTYPKKQRQVSIATLSKAGYSIKQFSQIHAMGCHHTFGLYLISENIPFYFWEDAAGILSRPYVLENIEKANVYDKTKYLTCIDIHAYDGLAPSIIKRYCNHSAQEAGFDLSNTIDFSVVKEMIQLEENVRKEIMSFFTSVQTIDIKKDSIVYLTQHFSTLQTLSFDENILINQLVFDYFFENENVVIKPHPDDVIYFDLLFSDSMVVREKFPSEFLTFMFNNKPKCIATISSTAINNLRDSVDSTFELGIRFEKEFYSIHRYDVATDIRNRLLADHSVVPVGAMQEVISKMTDTAKVGKNKYYIIDDISKDNKTKSDILGMIKDMQGSDVMVFINSQLDYCFYDIANKDIWRNIIPIVISKHQTRQDEFYSKENDEIIYLYTKDKKLVDVFKSYSYSKSLKHTGLDVVVTTLDDEDSDILVLDGMRYATEYMLRQIEEGSISDDSVSKIDESSMVDFTLSSKGLATSKQNQMRVLEGIIRSTEQRILYYIKER